MHFYYRDICNLTPFQFAEPHCSFASYIIINNNIGIGSFRPTYDHLSTRICAYISYMYLHVLGAENVAMHIYLYMLLIHYFIIL